MIHTYCNRQHSRVNAMMMADFVTMFHHTPLEMHIQMGLHQCKYQWFCIHFRCSKHKSVSNFIFFQAPSPTSSSSASASGLIYWLAIISPSWIRHGDENICYPLYIFFDPKETKYKIMLFSNFHALVFNRFFITISMSMKVGVSFFSIFLYYFFNSVKGNQFELNITQLLASRK